MFYSFISFWKTDTAIQYSCEIIIIKKFCTNLTTKTSLKLSNKSIFPYLLLIHEDGTVK